MVYILELFERCNLDNSGFLIVSREGKGAGAIHGAEPD